MCDVAERLEKMGIEKGIEIGRSEGEIKGKMLVYKNLCKEGFDEKEARRLAELPENIIPVSYTHLPAIDSSDINAVTGIESNENMFDFVLHISVHYAILYV